VFIFQGKSLIWPLHRSLQGQRAKGAAERMEERKITPACGQQHGLELTPKQSDLSLAGGDDLHGRR